MKNGAEAPSSTIEALQKERDALKKQNAELTLKLKGFEKQFRLSQKRQFGASSEKTHPDPEQLTLQLFNEAESESNPQAPEPTVETITYKREKTIVFFILTEIHQTPVIDNIVCLKRIWKSIEPFFMY
ncbi:transposase [Sporolactobacillus sp. KGMB 08714]|uniref:transposase n=1 Tax=Sporolactobacillus sp. KGMB 08714 TaxID=3064704 RepID=UPI002FBE921A